MDNSRLLLVLVLLAGCSGGEVDAEDSSAMPDAGTAMPGSPAQHVARPGAPAHDVDAAMPATSAHDAGAAMPATPAHDASSPLDQADAGPSSCPVVQGLFTPVYTPVSGNCGPIVDPSAVPFDGGADGVSTNIERRPNATTTTAIVLAGCRVHMTQTVADATGTKQLQIDGPKLSIESASRITGSVELTRFDASGQITCMGTYDAAFSK